MLILTLLLYNSDHSKCHTLRTFNESYELIIRTSNPAKSFATIFYCISKERKSLKSNLPIHDLTPS